MLRQHILWERNKFWMATVGIFHSKKERNASMIQFKHKETGEVVRISKVRTYINDDGSKRNVDLAGEYDLSDYEEVREDTNYQSILCTKAPNERRG